MTGDAEHTSGLVAQWRDRARRAEQRLDDLERENRVLRTQVQTLSTVFRFMFGGDDLDDHR